MLGAVVLLCAGASPAAAACPDEQLSTKDPGATQPRLRAAVVCLVNEARNARGLASLRYDTQLEQAAQSHTDDMATRGYVEHSSPEGTRVEQRAPAAGYEWWSIKENLGQGQVTPFAVVERWLGSDQHCPNIFHLSVVDTGVGVRTDKDLWTQVFGRRKGRGAPEGTPQSCPASMGRAAGAPSTPPKAPPPVIELPEDSGGRKPGTGKQRPPSLKSVRVVGRAVRVVAACDGRGAAPTSCRLQAALSVKVGRRTMSLGRAGGQVVPGQTLTFTLRPNAAGRRTIARGSGRNVRLTVVLRDLRARRDVARRAVTLRRATFR